MMLQDTRTQRPEIVTPDFNRTRTLLFISHDQAFERGALAFVFPFSGNAKVFCMMFALTNTSELLAAAAV